MNKNIAAIHFIDMHKENKNNLSGNYAIQLDHTHNAQLRTMAWYEHVFGESGLKLKIPGFVQTHFVHDYPPVFTALQFCDFSNPAIESFYKNDPEQAERAQTYKREQTLLRYQLQAPSIPCAIMAAALGYLVNAEEISTAEASATIAKQFGMGKTTADVIIRNSVAHTSVEKARQN